MLAVLREQAVETRLAEPREREIRGTVAAGLRRQAVGDQGLDLSEEAVRRPLGDSVAALEAFIDANAGWVIEGCYGDLIEAALPSCTELRFLNPQGWAERRSVTVKDGSEFVNDLNELEWVKGAVWANVWRSICQTK